jgi:DNA-binding GntR family transcriptional regulator
VIDVDLLSVIRRWYHRDKLPIREIRRRTGLSRNTIRKYLANGEVSPTYPVRKSVSKLDPFAELPKRFKRLQNTLIKQDGGDREMADILALVLHHDEKLVEQAVREAIASGIISSIAPAA